MTRTLIGIFILCLLLIGCATVTHYDNVQKMPDKAKALVEKVDSFYLNKAIKKASFLAKCDINKITTEVISYGQPKSLGYGDWSTEIFVLENTKETLEIGVDACGNRLIYKVICGPDDNYTWGVIGNTKDLKKSLNLVCFCYNC